MTTWWRLYDEFRGCWITTACFINPQPHFADDWVRRCSRHSWFSIGLLPSGAKLNHIRSSFVIISVDKGKINTKAKCSLTSWGNFWGNNQERSMDMSTTRKLRVSGNYRVYLIKVYNSSQEFFKLATFFRRKYINLRPYLLEITLKRIRIGHMYL